MVGTSNLGSWNVMVPFGFRNLTILDEKRALGHGEMIISGWSDPLLGWS